jgi:uncharacterized damage-inducible protein DinB
MPTAVSILQRLHQHSAWANEKLVEAAATLSPEELRQSQGIGEGNVWQSLFHILPRVSRTRPALQHVAREGQQRTAQNERFINHCSSTARFSRQLAQAAILLRNHGSSLIIVVPLSLNDFFISRS